MDGSLGFKNHNMNDLASEHGFEAKHSSPYHSQTTSAVKKHNDMSKKNI